MLRWTANNILSIFVSHRFEGLNGAYTMDSLETLQGCAQNEIGIKVNSVVSMYGKYSNNKILVCSLCLPDHPELLD